MRLKVNEGWEPGITVGDTIYRPSETFDVDNDARQFLDNGSAVEAPPNPSAAAGGARSASYGCFGCWFGVLPVDSGRSDSDWYHTDVQSQSSA
jgi:hypothetical protein